MPSQPIYKRKLFKITVSLVVATLLLVVLHVPVLKAMGRYLRNEDEPVKTTYLFVLSGGAYDRGNAAANLYKKGLVDTIVLTGANIAQNLKALGITVNEAQLTDSALVRFGVPQSRIILIPRGTSTLEETYIIDGVCKDKGIKTACVLTDKFHTGRTRIHMEKVLKKDNIELKVFGSPSSQYDEDNWWKSENGLLMVNSEYTKELYYLFN